MGQRCRVDLVGSLPALLTQTIAPFSREKDMGKANLCSGPPIIIRYWGHRGSRGVGGRVVGKSAFTSLTHLEKGTAMHRPSDG